MSNQDDIIATIAGIHSRLDTLASITASNIFIPGGPQSRYYAIIEEAYAALAQQGATSERERQMARRAEG